MTHTPRPQPHKNSSWPDEIQTLLLRACLCRGDEAIDAWHAWQRKIAFDDLDIGSMRLVPMLYHNLRANGVESRGLGRYQGLYRRSWYMNQILFRRAEAVLALFHRAGIRTLVLKGLPVAHLYYPETGLRPMDDFDVLVPSDQTRSAIALLERGGWKPYKAPPHGLKWHPDFFRRSWNFIREGDANVDLHWRTLITTMAPNADDAFWNDSEPFRLGSVETLTLNATDHLMHTCVHGIPWNEVASIRWVVDATMLLRSRRIDARRLARLVEEHCVSVMMCRALGCLRDHFGATLPDDLEPALERIAPEPWERSEFDVVTRPGHTARRWNFYVSNFRRLRRTTPLLANRSIIPAYFEYLRLRWCLDHKSQIPKCLAQKIIPKLLTALRLRGTRQCRPALAAVGQRPSSQP